MVKLKRDKDYIRSLVEIKGDKIYCKEKCTIEFPLYYFDKEMGLEDDETQFYGVFALIVGDKYSVSLIPTICISEPIDIAEVERNGMKYRQLKFGKGDCIISSKKVLAVALKAYNLFESFFMRGNVPWFLEYEDVVKVMDNLVPYAQSDVGRNLIANELLTAFIARNENDKNVFLRQVEGKGSPEWVSIMSPQFSITSTSTRLAGGYMSQNISSALVNPSKKNTKLDLHMKG